MNREDFTKKAHAKSAFEGKLAVAASSLVDAWIHGSPQNQSNFLNRLLVVANDYAQGVLGWDKAAADTALATCATSLRLPRKSWAADYPADAPLKDFLEAAVKTGNLTVIEAEQIKSAAGSTATVGDMRRAFAAAERLRS